MKKITVLALALLFGLVSIAFSNAANFKSTCPCNSLKLTVTGKVSAPTDKLAVGCKVMLLSSKGHLYKTAWTGADGSYKITISVPRKKCGPNCCFFGDTLKIKVQQNSLKGSYPYVDVFVYDPCQKSIRIGVPTIELVAF